MNQKEDPNAPSVSYQKSEGLRAQHTGASTGFRHNSVKRSIQKYRKATLNSNLTYALKEKNWDEILKDDNLAENSATLSQWKDCTTQSVFSKPAIEDYKKKLKIQEDVEQKQVIKFSVSDSGDLIYRMNLKKRICMYLTNSYWLRVRSECNSYHGINFLSISPSLVYNHDRIFAEVGYEISRRNCFYFDIFYRVSHQLKTTTNGQNKNKTRIDKYLDRFFDTNRKYPSIFGLKYTAETHNFPDIQNSLSFYYSFNQVFKSYVTFNSLHQREGNGLKHEAIYQPTIGSTILLYENKEKGTNLIVEGKALGVSKFDSFMFGLKFKKYFNDNFFYSIALRSYDLSLVATSRLCLLYKDIIRVGVDYDLSESKTGFYLYFDLKGFKLRIPIYQHFTSNSGGSLKDYLYQGLGFVWGTTMAIFSFNYLSKLLNKTKSKAKKIVDDTQKKTDQRHKEQEMLLKTRIEKKKTQNFPQDISFAIFTDLKTLSNEEFCSELKSADNISELAEQENYKKLEKKGTIFDVTTFAEYYSTGNDLTQKEGPKFGFPGFPEKDSCNHIIFNKLIILIKYSIGETKRLKYFYADAAVHVSKDHDLEGYTI